MFEVKLYPKLPLRYRSGEIEGQSFFLVRWVSQNANFLMTYDNHIIVNTRCITHCYQYICYEAEDTLMNLELI